MLGKLRGLVFLLMLLSVPLWMYQNGSFGTLEKALSSKKNALGKVETALSANFPGLQYLQRLRVELNYLGGNKEQNGVFIANDMLLLDVQPKEQAVIDQNVRQMLELAVQLERPSYLILIPTSCAVQQSKVPYNSFAPLYNQRDLIDSVYRQMAGNVTAIDVYPTLFNHQNEYIYYRTDSTPTGLGGYYIYTAAAQKLGFPNPRGFEQFSAMHVDYNYYGDLYDISPYRQVHSDRITTYLFSRGWRSYTVTHHDSTGTRKYYTLYPEFKKELGNSMDIIFGGVSPIVDIAINNAQYNRSLLVLGDRSMQSYLPFFLNHYSRVTFVDTAQMPASLLDTVRMQEYSQVLFAYSVDRFVTQDLLSPLRRLLAE